MGDQNGDWSFLVIGSAEILIFSKKGLWSAETADGGIQQLHSETSTLSAEE